ncbi:MAG: SRPBCC family protein [Luteimonas sp.]|nr:SRPBCC family protein [Luteimonas sp.]
MRLHKVTVTREAVIPGAPADVFAFIAAEDVLPKVLTGYLVLPAVVRTSGNTGPWDVPGSARVVHLADGTTAREQVTEFSPPDRFAYKVWDFGNPILKRLASEARGEWTFVAAPGGTRVTWTYTFIAKNGVAAIPLSGIAQVLWRGYMDVCLENSVRLMTPTSTTARALAKL